jgi:hypothetical protein
MSGGAALPFPASRALAGWWRQLASLQPDALWVGHLLLHHIEALVRLRRLFRLHALSALILHALALESMPCPMPLSARPLPANPGEDQLQRLDARMRLGRQLLRQILRALARQGLAQEGTDGCWILADAGRQALEEGQATESCLGRRSFYFVDQENQTADRDASAAFLSLHPGTAAPWAAGEDWHFNTAALRACVAQSAPWKQARGFPMEIVDTVTDEDDHARDAGMAAAWQRVLVDRPEHLAVVIARQAGGRMLGFAFQLQNWTLQVREPVFTLVENETDDLAGWCPVPSPATWRQAWQLWAQQRGLAPAEAEACAVEPAGVQLRVLATPGVFERLRSGPPDIFKGEAWILAGAGRLRGAARLQLVELDRP